MQLEFVGEKTITIEENETMLHASLAAGIPHFHVCGGSAKCSTCRVLIIEGAHYVTPPSDTEKRLTEQMHFPNDVRLACQIAVTGGLVRVQRIIRDEDDIGLYIGEKEGSNGKILGEEKELALLFVDIRNFTPFVESHLSFDVIHIIRKLFHVFQNCIEANNGRIVETMGDGVYAIFGYQSEKEKSAADAVQAAYCMLSKLDNLNKTYFNRYFQEKLQIGIGIHVGKVVSGTIQMRSREHHVVMGYPVNIAARLQNATKEVNNNLVVSAELYALLSKPLAHKPVSIHAKGVSSPLIVYLLGKPYSLDKSSIATSS